MATLLALICAEFEPDAFPVPKTSPPASRNIWVGRADGALGNAPDLLSGRRDAKHREAKALALALALDVHIGL
eukprot:2472040-Heterocapsa_arctica.AAC.1